MLARGKTTGILYSGDVRCLGIGTVRHGAEGQSSNLSNSYNADCFGF